MGKWLYKKLESPEIQGICVVCNTRPQKRGSNKKYRSICTYCNKKLYDTENARKYRITQTDKQKRPYRQFLKPTCESCGFIPVHNCQLDVDHIDGNHSNNEESNLQTLCANCHRLKTYSERKKLP